MWINDPVEWELEMKVVLFCGGQGLRLREFDQNTPKPMVPVGYRPIVWHLMKYYAHYGHKEFILCLGYRADAIKSYFLNYDECVSNDFVLSSGGRDVKMLGTDIDDWKITFVDTGIEANIGQRLMAVRDHIGSDEVFLANYADGLTDVPVPTLIDHHKQSGKVASFLGVHPSATFHTVKLDAEGEIEKLQSPSEANLWVNGGFFVFRREIFDYMQPGEELVVKPFERLAKAGQLTCYRHDGFWACMDTFKEKMVLDDLIARGNAPWTVWKPKQQVKIA